MALEAASTGLAGILNVLFIAKINHFYKLAKPL